MEITSNYWDFADSLILRKNGGVFAVFEVPSEVLVTIDKRGRERFKQTAFSAFSQISVYGDFELHTIPIPIDLYERFELLRQDIDQDSGTAPLANLMMDSLQEKIEDEIEFLFEYKHYISIPLKSNNISPDLVSTLKDSMSFYKKETLKLLGLGELPPLNWYEDWQLKKNALKSALHQLRVREVEKTELEFLARLQFLRGQFYDKETEVDAIKNCIDNIDDTNIYFENHKVLRLENKDDDNLVACFPIVDYPQNVSSIHLQEELQLLDFPVESIYKVAFSADKGVSSSKKKARNKRKNLGNVVAEIEEDGDIQRLEVLEAHQMLVDYQEKVESKEKMVEFLHFLVVTGDDEDEIEERYDILSKLIANLGGSLARGYADRLYLFYKGRFTELLDKKRESYVQYTSLEGFCQNMFFVTKEVGNKVGFPIARIDNEIASWGGDFMAALQASNRLVFSNLLQANKMGIKDKITNNPHVAITGATGNGKSFLMKLLFTLNSFLKIKSAYIDPKTEVRKQYMKILKEYEEQNIHKEVQEYIKSIHFVTLDMKEDRNIGVLDPFAYIDEKTTLTEIASVLISTVLDKEDSKKLKSYLLENIDKVWARKQNGETVGMLHLFKTFEEEKDKDVARIGRYLSKMGENTLLKLCFSDGSNKSLQSDNKITVFEIAGLDMPKTSNYEDMTDTQLRSLAVMYGLTFFCADFGERDRTQETLLYVDEAWQISLTPSGRQLLARIKRTGRSFNNFLVLATQSVKDVSTEDDGTGFGTVFAFSEDSETSSILEHLKIKEDDLSKAWVENQTMGQCIFSDVFGRRERITVDGTIYDSITPLFETVTTNLKSTG